MGKEVNMKTKEIKIGVCKGRHEMPCDMYVFNEISDPTDVLWMKFESLRFFVNNFGDEFSEKGQIETPLKIYVTGLTVALIVVMRFASCFFSDVTLMHYNSKTGEYYPQQL